jgi:hypothetical protein
MNMSKAELKTFFFSSQTPVLQYIWDLFHSNINWLLPFGLTANLKENIPGAGSFEFFHEISCFDFPVILSIPSFAPGSHVSVGWSKLSQKIVFWLELSLKTKFPSSPSTASVEFDRESVKFVDQTGILEEPSSRTRLPS